MDLELLPESVSASNTIALEHTFAFQLIGLNVDQISIDLVGERDMVKLTMLLQQFGVPIDMLPDDMSDFALRELLSKVIKIHKTSGTLESMQLMAEAIGGRIVSINQDYHLRHNGDAVHNELYLYNAGREYEKYSLTIIIDGVGETRRSRFDKLFKQLFTTFQPVSLWLSDIIHEDEILCTEDNQAIISNNYELIKVFKND